MMRITMLFTFLLSFSLAHTMEMKIEEFSQKSKQPKYAIVHPFFDDETIIPVIRQTLDAIEKRKLTYPDYSGRKGGIWSDFRVDGDAVTERFDTVKLTEVNGELKKRNPEVMRDYPEIESIVSRSILPKMLAIIKEKQWETAIPEKIEASVYIQRCETSDAMDWHQDPGEDFGDVDDMANYSLILMLSKQLSKKHGWNGEN